MTQLSRAMQRVLLALGVVALIFLLVEIGASLAATQSGSIPARVDHVTAGPYRFTVRLYDDPARAGFALPFKIAPEGVTSGTWTYQVTSVPQGQPLRGGLILVDGKRTATPVRDSFNPDPRVPGGIQGAAEITVAGPWALHVEVDGPAGKQAFDVAITATTLPAIPPWVGALFEYLPVCGILVFLVMRIALNKTNSPTPLQAA